MSNGQAVEGYAALKDIDMSVVWNELSGMNKGMERIRIPYSDSPTYEMPGGYKNKPENVKEFKAVILLQHTFRVYYKSDYSGEKCMPDCGSNDGKYGAGSPGGECGICPHNEFGTGKNGSKACKERRAIYVLREGEIFPLLLSLPTGSVDEFGDYIRHILSLRKMPWEVVTRFYLTEKVNGAGKPYSQACFEKDENDLLPEEIAAIKPFIEYAQEYSSNSAFERVVPAVGSPEIDLGDDLEEFDEIPF